MSTDLIAYTQILLQAYLDLPDTPSRCSSFDQAVARKLFQQHIPLPSAKAALALASMRRRYRSADALPLPPIRSLAYFLPVIEEVRSAPPDYWDYCWNRFLSLQKALAL